MSDLKIPPEAVSALEQGNQIKAIQLTRESTGAGLADAKKAIDAYVTDNPRLGRRLISERTTGGPIKILGFIGLLILAGLLYLLAETAFATGNTVAPIQFIAP